MLSTKLQIPILFTPKTLVVYGNVSNGKRYPDIVNILLYTTFFLIDDIMENYSKDL